MEELIPEDYGQKPENTGDVSLPAFGEESIGRGPYPFEIESSEEIGR
jgi:hypothetical protein